MVALNHTQRCTHSTSYPNTHGGLEAHTTLCPQHLLSEHSWWPWTTHNAVSPAPPILTLMAALNHTQRCFPSTSYPNTHGGLEAHTTSNEFTIDRCGFKQANKGVCPWLKFITKPRVFNRIETKENICPKETFLHTYYISISLSH